jgi:hypothetical protein
MFAKRLILVGGSSPTVMYSPPASVASGLLEVLLPTPPKPPPRAPGILPSALAPGLSIPPPIVPIFPVPNPPKADPPILPGVFGFSPVVVAPIVLLEAGPPTIAGSLGSAPTAWRRVGLGG